MNATFVLSDNTYNLVLGGGGAKLGSSKKTSKEELRAIEKGFDSYSEFVKFMLEFSLIQSIIKYIEGKDLSVFEVMIIKMKIKEGFKVNESKLIKYKKFQSEIIWLIQYVMYGN